MDAIFFLKKSGLCAIFKGQTGPKSLSMAVDNT